MFFSSFVFLSKRKDGFLLGESCSGIRSIAAGQAEQQEEQYRAVKQRWNKTRVQAIKPQSLPPLSEPSTPSSKALVPKAAFLSLWAMTPLGVRRPFHRGRLRHLDNTDVYATVRNRSKITVMKKQ